MATRKEITSAVRLITPPILVSLAQLVFRKGTTNYIEGNYGSWGDALAESSGYDADAILEATSLAMQRVKSGDVAFERDSITFDTIEYNWPVLAGLLWAASRHAGDLNVLDIGGSLGSSYFQHITFFEKLLAIRWNVLEQPRHVQEGKRLIEDDVIRFYSSLDQCYSETQPRVALLSSVLQYLEHPYALLDELVMSPCDVLIIDRVPFWRGATDRLCVQHVSPSIYPASYPCWVFSEKSFLAVFNRCWEVRVEFSSLDRLANNLSAEWKGLIAVRR